MGLNGDPISLSLIPNAPFPALIPAALFTAPRGMHTRQSTDTPRVEMLVAVMKYIAHIPNHALFDAFGVATPALPLLL